VITSPLPINTNRYAIRFDGAVPMPNRLSREMQGLVAAGVTETDADAQAMQDGVPVWGVRFVLRDRDSGAVEKLNIRTVAGVQPLTDFTTGQHVTFDQLTVAFSSFNGRLNTRWAYTGIRPTDPVTTALASGRALQRFGIDSSPLIISVEGIEPKLTSHEDDVRQAIQRGAIDAAEIASQRRDRNNEPLWTVHCRIENGLNVEYEAITIPAQVEPRHIDGQQVIAENLEVSGWALGGRDAVIGTTLFAAALHLAPTSKPSKAAKPERAVEPQPEPVPA